VDQLKGKTPITTKWIFKVKRNMQGGNKFKARLMA